MKGKRALIITGPGFEDVEVIYPYFRLKEEGLLVDVATSNNQEVIGKHGVPFRPTVKIENLSKKNYDILIIPGGHEAPDRIRQVPEILLFVREMFLSEKLISSICHGPWVLISAGIMKNMKATCYIGMKDDLQNAGAKYINKDVVVDGNLITSDHPRNLSAWMKTTISLIKQ